MFSKRQRSEPILTIPSHKLMANLRVLGWKIYSFTLCFEYCETLFGAFLINQLETQCYET